MKKLFLMAGLFLAVAPAWASALVLDFEGFLPGQIIDDEYSEYGVHISAINLGGGPNIAAVFDTNNFTGGDDDLAAPFFNSNGLGTLSPGNVLIIQENDNCDSVMCTTPDDEGSRPAGYFTITFDVPVTLNSIDFFDIEGAESPNSSDNQISLYGVNGLITNAFWTPDTGGDNTWDQLLFGISGVTMIEIRMGGSGALDNLDFTPVPVPAAVWLLGSGLFGLFATRRRLRVI